MSAPVGSGGTAIKALRHGSIVEGEDRQNQVRVCTYYFKGNKECLQRCIKENNWIEEKEENPSRCVYVWFGNHVNHYARSGDIKTALTSRHQRSSRLDGMRVLAFKEHSQIYLERLRSLFPDQLPFFPRGWCLPEEQIEFDKTLKKNSKLPQVEKSTFIVKPSETSQGSGIFLAQTPEHLPPHFNERGRNYVVQEYIKDPMLLEGFKFDLRLYVVVLSVDPLRVYLSREGMARICSEQYHEPAPDNLSDVYSHLTNYSLNKKNENYIFTRASVNHSQQSSDDEFCGDRTVETADSGLLEEKTDRRITPSSSYSTTLPSICSPSVSLSVSPVKSPLLARRTTLTSPSHDSPSSTSSSSSHGFNSSLGSPVKNIKVAKYSLAKRRSSFMEVIEDKSVGGSVDSNERNSGDGSNGDGKKSSIMGALYRKNSLSSEEYSYEDDPNSPMSNLMSPTSPSTKSNFLSVRRRSSMTMNSLGSQGSSEYDDATITQIQQISMQQPSTSFKGNGAGIVGGAGGGGGGVGGGALARRNRQRSSSSSSRDGSGGGENQSTQLDTATTQFQIFVNHFTAKDFISFSGLYPTIANKLVNLRPFKSKKQMYAGLEDIEVARLKKFDKLISLNAPPASFDLSKVKRPPYRASTGTLTIPAEYIATARTLSSNSSENGVDHTIEEKKSNKSSRNARRRYSTTGSYSKNDAHTGVIPKPTSRNETTPVSEPNSARLSTRTNPVSSGVSTPSSTRGTGSEEEEEEEAEEEDLGIEETDGPPGSKRRLLDVFPLLASEYDFEEGQFWENTVDLVAKTLIALQPELAFKYREMFPKRKRRGVHGADIESSEDEEEDSDDDGAKTMSAQRQQRSQKKKSKSGQAGRGKGKVIRDPLRPTYLDETVKEVDGEEGDDSFRCFQLLGFDVLLDRQGQPHLLEINSNPSLNIMHECKGEDGLFHSEPSPIDEKIKMTVMRDMLKVSFGTGKLPEDKDSAALGSLIPVITKARYYMYREFMVLERIRHVFEHCCGVRYRKTGGVGSIAFQRVGRKLQVKAAIADLVFVKACSGYRVPGHKLDHLDLSQFTEALYELCVADDEDSFAFKQLDSFKSEDEDGEKMRSDILVAAVEQYFNEDEDDEDEDSDESDDD